MTDDETALHKFCVKLETVLRHEQKGQVKLVAPVICALLMLFTEASSHLESENVNLILVKEDLVLRS